MSLGVLLKPECKKSIKGFSDDVRTQFEALTTLGDLKILGVLMSEDLVLITSPDAAFRVTFVLPKTRYLNDYKSMWQKETLELTDNFYMLLRTIYRAKFGESFERVAVFGYHKYPQGQVLIPQALQTVQM